MEEVWDKFMMDRDGTTSSPGRATGEDVEGPEMIDPVLPHIRHPNKVT